MKSTPTADILEARSRKASLVNQVAGGGGPVLRASPLSDHNAQQMTFFLADEQSMERSITSETCSSRSGLSQGGAVFGVRSLEESGVEQSRTEEGKGTALEGD